MKPLDHRMSEQHVRDGHEGHALVVGHPGADDGTLGSYPVRMWSYPIVRDGLIYVVDIRNGLYVLKYTGPRASRVAAIDFAQGNAN